MVSEPLLPRLIDAKIDYINQRQVVLAQNVANVDTPNYKAKDLQAPDFQKMLKESASELAMARTNPAHLSPLPHTSAHYAIIAQEVTSELKPNGNNVSLDDQMKNVALNAAEYQLVLGLDSNADKLYNMVIGKPNGTSSG